MYASPDHRAELTQVSVVGADWMRRPDTHVTVRIPVMAHSFAIAVRASHADCPETHAKTERSAWWGHGVTVDCAEVLTTLASANHVTENDDAPITPFVRVACAWKRALWASHAPQLLAVHLVIVMKHVNRSRPSAKHANQMQSANTIDATLVSAVRLCRTA